MPCTTSLSPSQPWGAAASRLRVCFRWWGVVPRPLLTCVVHMDARRYGDISPKSRLGRVTIMVMITASMVIIPSQISKLSQMLSQRSVYGGAYRGGRPHVVVCGSVAANSLWHFLREFFHADNIHRNEKVIVLCPQEPCFEMKRLLMTPGCVVWPPIDP